MAIANCSQTRAPRKNAGVASDKPSAKCSSRQTELADSYRHVRAFSEHLAEPLETEDYVIQSMPDASPTK